MARLPALIGLLVFVVACGAETGWAAPEIGDLRTACNDVACVDYPEGWQVEIGETFISLRYPSSAAMATVGNVDMQGVTVANGGIWPAATESVVRDFWDLLGGGEDAELKGLETLDDGSIRSEGKLGIQNLWHRLIPVSGPTAVGVEVRGPDSSWEAHADVILGSTVPSGV